MKINPIIAVPDGGGGQVGTITAGQHVTINRVSANIRVGRLNVISLIITVDATIQNGGVVFSLSPTKPMPQKPIDGIAMGTIRSSFVNRPIGSNAFAVNGDPINAGPYVVNVIYSD